MVYFQFILFHSHIRYNWICNFSLSSWRYSLLKETILHQSVDGISFYWNKITHFLQILSHCLVKHSQERMTFSKWVSGADPGFLERGGVEPWLQFCRVKGGGRFTDFSHSDLKISVYISFLFNVSLIM